MNYKKDLEINIDALETEWLRQPLLYMQYAEALAGASLTRNKMKERLDVIRAGLDNQARTDSKVQEEMGGKVTEGSINNWIVLQLEYQDAQAKYFKAQYEAELLAGAVRAFDERKTALENEVRLWQGGYFSEPKETKMDDEIRGKRSERQRRGLK